MLSKEDFESQALFSRSMVHKTRGNKDRSIEACWYNDPFNLDPSLRITHETKTGAWLICDYGGFLTKVFSEQSLLYWLNHAEDLIQLIRGKPSHQREAALRTLEAFTNPRRPARSIATTLEELDL